MDTVGPMVAEPAHWEQDLSNFFERRSKRFGRREIQARAMGYVKGLLSPVERKNSWQLAEAREQRDPYSNQHF